MVNGLARGFVVRGALLALFALAVAAAAPAQATWNAGASFGIAPSSDTPSTATLTLLQGSTAGQYLLPDVAGVLTPTLYLTKEGTTLPVTLRSATATRHEYAGFGTSIVVQAVNPSLSLVEIEYRGARQPLAIVAVATDTRATSSTLVMRDHGMAIVTETGRNVYVVPGSDAALRVHEGNGFRMVLQLTEKRTKARYAITAVPMKPSDVDALAAAGVSMPLVLKPTEDVADAAPSPPGVLRR